MEQLSAEQRLKNIEDKTSAGNYALHYGKELGITIAGFVGGYFSFKAMHNTKFAKSMGKFFGDIFEKRTSAALSHSTASAEAQKAAKEGAEWVKDFTEKYFPWIGALLGGTVSGFINRYSNWKETESEKLGVAEVNKDVAHMMEERSKFAETLNRQESVIKDIIARKGQGDNTVSTTASEMKR